MNELREARAVLDRLEEGLCTVDPSLRVRSGWNAAFTRIFGEADFAGRSIIDVAFASVAEGQKKDIREALEVAFLSGASSDGMVDALLPFREYAYLRVTDTDLVKKSLSIGLDRLMSDGEVEALLLRFIDKTVVAAETEKEKEARAEMEDQYARIRQLLKNDRTSVSYFFEDLKSGNADLAVRLRSLVQGGINTRVIDEAVAIVHSIKGEALSLGFESTAAVVRSLESALKESRAAVLDMDTHLELISLYERLSNESRAFERLMLMLSKFLGGGAEASLEALTARLYELLEEFEASGYRPDALEAAVADAAAAAGDGASRDADAIERLLSMACQHAAQEERKLVKLVFASEIETFEPLVARNLKDALLHLVRNSVAHGVESPAERVASGKKPTGTVSVNISREGQGFRVDYSDDGRGLDLVKLKEKAVALGVVDREKADVLDDREAARLIFREGLSTRSVRADSAGLGYGMPAVAAIVLKRLRGKMGMTHRGDKGFSLRFTVPGSGR